MLATKNLKPLKCLNNLKFVTCRPFHGPPKEDEYVKEAQYPEIPKYRDENEKEYDSLKEVIKNLQTVEEKQIYLNKPKYYGWYSCVMNPEAVKPATLNFMQYVTNTTIVEDALPERFSEYDEVAKREAETLEPIGKDRVQCIFLLPICTCAKIMCIIFSLWKKPKKQRSRHFCQNVHSFNSTEFCMCVVETAEIYSHHFFENIS